MNTQRAVHDTTVKNGKKWEYCQIQMQVQDDGRDPTRAGHRMMWFQFQARTSKRIIQKSIRVPMANMVGAAAYAPQQNNLGHRNILNLLLEKLQQDGWELLPNQGSDWWQRTLRRPAPPQQARLLHLENLLRLKDWSFAVLAFILAIIFLWQAVDYYLTTPFPGGVRQYTQLDVITSNVAPYRTGKLLLVNLTNGRIDPLQAQLPPALQAQNRSEIGTLIWLDCELDGNWRWTVSDCLVTVIDYAQSTSVDTLHVNGSEQGDPATRVAGHFHDYETEIELRDGQAILAYILNLPEP